MEKRIINRSNFRIFKSDFDKYDVDGNGNLDQVFSAPHFHHMEHERS